MNDSRRKLLLETIPEIVAIGGEKFASLEKEARRCGWRRRDLEDPVLREAMRAAGVRFLT